MKIQDIEVIKISSGETRVLEKSYVFKYCQNTEHTFDRMSEMFVLENCASLFISPKFPKLYKVFKDQNSVKNLMFMEDLSFARTIPHIPGLRGL